MNYNDEEQPSLSLVCFVLCSLIRLPSAAIRDSKCYTFDMSLSRHLFDKKILHGTELQGQFMNCPYFNANMYLYVSFKKLKSATFHPVKFNRFCLSAKCNFFFWNNSVFTP